MLYIPEVSSGGLPVPWRLRESASRVARRMTRVADRYHIDYAVVANTIEAAVDGTCRSLQSGRDIRNLDRYLFRAAIRQLLRVTRDRFSLEDTELSSLSDCGRWQEQTDRRLLFEELLARVDCRSAEIVRMRRSSMSWKKIGSILGMSPHSAEQTLQRTIRRLKLLINTQDARAE